MPLTEAMLMTREGSSAVAAARSRGSSFWVRKKIDLTFRSTVLSQPSSGYSSMGAPQVAPALFTSTSSRLSRSLTALARPSMPAMPPRSKGSEMQVPYSDSSSATRSQTSALREEI